MMRLLQLMLSMDRGWMERTNELDPCILMLNSKLLHTSIQLHVNAIIGNIIFIYTKQFNNLTRFHLKFK